MISIPVARFRLEDMALVEGSEVDVSPAPGVGVLGALPPGYVIAPGEILIHGRALVAHCKSFSGRADECDCTWHG